MRKTLLLLGALGISLFYSCSSDNQDNVSEELTNVDPVLLTLQLDENQITSKPLHIGWKALAETKFDVYYNNKLVKKNSVDNTVAIDLQKNSSEHEIKLVSNSAKSKTSTTSEKIEVFATYGVHSKINTVNEYDYDLLSPFPTLIYGGKSPGFIKIKVQVGDKK